MTGYKTATHSFALVLPRRHGVSGGMRNGPGAWLSTIEQWTGLEPPICR